MRMLSGEPTVVSACMLEDRADHAQGSQVNRMLLPLMQTSATAEHCTRDRLPHPLKMCPPQVAWVMVAMQHHHYHLNSSRSYGVDGLATQTHWEEERGAACQVTAHRKAFEQPLPSTTVAPESAPQENGRAEHAVVRRNLL